MSNRLTTDQLEKLPTPRLLKLYRARQVERDCMGTDYLHMIERPEVQEYLELDGYCQQLKTLLNKREHVGSD